MEHCERIEPQPLNRRDIRDAIVAGMFSFTVRASNGVVPDAAMGLSITISGVRPSSTLPKTGDGFPIIPLLALMGVSLFAIWFLLRFER